MDNADIAPTSRQDDSYKVAAMLWLGLGSFLIGLLPALISNRSLTRFALTTSFLLCFGAGILLSTSLVHMLPDVQKAIPKYAEIIFCGGFFIVYFIDEFVHYFFGEAIQHKHSENDHHRLVNYGTITECEPLTQHNRSNRKPINADIQVCTSAHCDDVAIANANARICHTSHLEPCDESKTGTLGLFVALSLHSLIEGLAIGVQDSTAKVVFLVGAVSCHKFVMAFCLGLEFRSKQSSGLRLHSLGIVAFSLGSILGIAIGMSIVEIPSDWKTVIPVIQALAAGTLFYVTVCEVIPREKARWHQNSERKIAGFALFSAVTIGFIVMTLIDQIMKGE